MSFYNLQMTKVDPNLREQLLDIKVRMVNEKYQVKTSKQVIIFGNIGSGKTSFSSVMTGKNVKVVIDDWEPTLQYEEIDNLNESEGYIPTVMVDESNDISFVDMKSFENEHGYLQEIKRAFSIYNVINSKKKEANAKILILMNCHDFYRFFFEIVHNLFARVDSMFPHLTESEKGAVGLVVTCEENGRPVNQYIKKLCRRDSIQKWGEYFINRPEQLFVIPAATEDMVNETFTFDDKNRLIEFLIKDQFIDPSPNLTLGEDSRLYLNDCFSCHVCDLLNEVNEIIKNITDIYEQITKGEDLNEWSNKIQNISQMKINNPRNLLDLIQNNFADNKNKFDRSIEKLEDLDALHSFFIDVLKIDDQHIIDGIEKPINNEMTKLVSEFNTYKYYIIQQEEAEKIER